MKLILVACVLLMLFVTVIANSASATECIDYEQILTPNGHAELPTGLQALDGVVLEDLVLLACLEGLGIYDISEVGDPQAVGSTSVGEARGVCAAGDIVYLAVRDPDPPDPGNLVAMSIADPGAPVLIASVQAEVHYESSMALMGDYLLLSFLQGVNVFDVSDSLDIHEVSSLWSAGGDDVWDIAVSGSLALLAGGQGFEIWDLSDPLAPFRLSATSYAAQATAVEVQGDHAYVCTETSVLRCYDISDPAAPVEKDSIQFPYIFSSMAIAEGHLFLSGGPGSGSPCAVLDTGSPDQLVLEGYGDVGGRVVLAKNARLFLAGGSALDEYSLTQAGALVNAFTVPAPPRGLAIGDGLLYVGSDDVGGDGRLYVYDVSQPESPQLLSAFDPGCEGLRGSIARAGDFLFMASSDGMQVIDATDPYAPVVVAEAGSECSTITLNDGLAYTATFSGIEIFDVTDPTSPVELGNSTAATQFLWDVSTTKVGPYLYLCYWVGYGDYYSQLNIYDIQNPSDPALVEELNLGSSLGEGLAAMSGWLLSSGLGLGIWDIADPVVPVLAGGLPSEFSPFRQILVDGSYAYITDNHAIDVVDAVDPANPGLLARLSTSSGAAYQGLCLAGDLLYAADHTSSEIHIYRAQCGPVPVLTPTNLTFASRDCQPIPDSEQITITNAGNDPMNWSASPSESWLSCSPSSGSGDATLNVAVDPSGLADGIHSATLDFSINAGPPSIAAEVLLTVGTHTWHVPGDWPTLTTALAASACGDSVLLGAGTYPEFDLSLPSGVVLAGSTGHAEDVTIDALGLGRGLHCVGADSMTTLADLTITGGDASVLGANAGGGGIYCESGALRIVRCVVRNNAGALAGGGVLAYDATVACIDCQILANEASYGGGVFLASSNLAMTGSLIASNHAGTQASAMWVSASTGSLQASIMALNTGSAPLTCANGSEFEIGCSLFHGNEVPASLCTTDLGNNLFTDPLFCDAASSDYHLASNSPCLPENNDCELLIGPLGEGCTAVAVAEESPEVPGLAFLGAHPNPFNPTVMLSFSLPTESDVRIELYDLSGRRVRMLLSGQRYSSGLHTVPWDGCDDCAVSLPSGVYFCRFTVGAHCKSSKLTLLR